MNDNDLVSQLAQILQRGDKLASYKDAGGLGSAQSAGHASPDNSLQLIQKETSAIRMVFSGLALILISIFTMQIGNAFSLTRFGWVFYVGAALHLLVGVAQFDRGLKRLDAERLE